MKAKSIKIGVLASMLVAAFSPAFADPNPVYTLAPIDLTGRIILPNQSVKATILVCNALLKTNFESSISMRYPPLPVRARTDGQGDFKIGSLDPQWLYSGYVMAPGCQLKWLSQIDPTAPLNVSLEAADTNVSQDRILHGQVVDPLGHPIPGALIEIRGSTRNASMTWPAFDVDPYFVSDQAGNFVIIGKTAFDAVDGTVAADGFAESDFAQWPSDADNQEWARTGTMPEGLAGFARPVHQMTLVEGASLDGRLLSSGKPVANAQIRLNACGARSNCWFWKEWTLTDAQGKFVFSHLPPNQSFSICGSWDLPASGCAVPQTNVHLGENDSANNIGDIEAVPVCPVAGKILLSNGKPLPPKSFYFLGDDSMGNSLSSPFGIDGSFRFPAVPGDQVSIYLRVPGYGLTPRDFRLKSGSVTNITVSVSSTNLVFEMRPFSRSWLP
ncbi:MAG TPA: carboxypeptidase-like regulatory domain-containing protein [Candidatus Sulfotelmatobacter sp.]|nr:carboxypeptidase-like regulatory domain-containing protein [Candidatus Sulfotelmatobacter sp.]